MRFKNYFLLLLVLFLSGCGTCNKKTKIAAWATIIDGTYVKSGDVITGQLRYIDGEEPIDSIAYTLNGVRILASNALSEPVKVFTDTMKLGSYNFLATVYHEGKKEEHAARITLISNITPQQLPKQIGEVYPHSNQNFTEGLYFHNGMLYESTGMEGTSFICRYKLGSKTPERLTTLPREYFGEGSILFNNKLIQLTWRNGVGVVYDATTLKQIHEFRIPGEGWGLTYDGASLIMSNGSHRLLYLDTATFATNKIVEIFDNRGRVDSLNELEYADGVIYANRWMSDKIAKIDAKTGKVLAYINCEGLLTEEEIRENNCDVLNGIAYNPQTKKLYITGKNWPKIFELKI
jgi:glutamine cyclotransferase